MIYQPSIQARHNVAPVKRTQLIGSWKRLTTSGGSNPDLSQHSGSTCLSRKFNSPAEAGVLNPSAKQEKELCVLAMLALYLTMNLHWCIHFVKAISKVRSGRFSQLRIMILYFKASFLFVLKSRHVLFYFKQSFCVPVSRFMKGSAGQKCSYLDLKQLAVSEDRNLATIIQKAQV